MVNGDLQRVGELNTHETDGSRLVLDRVSPKFRQGIGAKIRLQSLQDRSSLSRRRSAVNRILDKECVIPSLIDYFDPSVCPPASVMESEPTNDELDAYDHHEDGELRFTLNPQQREAFRTLWSQGPLSLLQGPPGTGKTAFIASFIHYALSRGARNILLASQSHEAVNNAAEKAIELCRRSGRPLEVVRFGSEGMISEPLRPFHSTAILEAYRDLFQSEIRSRIASLSGNLGLPLQFVDQWCEIEFDLNVLVRDLTAFRKARQKKSWVDCGSGSLPSE